MPAMTRAAASRTSRGAGRAIVLAWLLAGTLDVTTAVTYYPLTANVTAKQILQGIASGVLGAQAFRGGYPTAALGLGLHYLIALIWTLFFYLAARTVPQLTRRPFIVGPLYGTFVWFIMNLVVLPLSALHARGSRSTDIDHRSTMWHPC